MIKIMNQQTELENPKLPRGYRFMEPGEQVSCEDLVFYRGKWKPCDIGGGLIGDSFMKLNFQDSKFARCKPHRCIMVLVERLQYIRKDSNPKNPRLRSPLTVSEKWMCSKCGRENQERV